MIHTPLCSPRFILVSLCFGYHIYLLLRSYTVITYYPQYLFSQTLDRPITTADFNISFITCNTVETVTPQYKTQSEILTLKFKTFTFAYFLPRPAFSASLILLLFLTWTLYIFTLPSCLGPLSNYYTNPITTA